MQILFYSSLFICIAIVAHCIYMLFRNYKVYKFRRWVADDLIFTDYDYPKRLNVYHKISYIEMLNSYKPLKLESFYSDEEIQILKSGIKTHQQH